MFCWLWKALLPPSIELIGSGTALTFVVTGLLCLQDPCYFVRLRFALKLHKGLLSLRLPLEYMSIFSLAANDPLKERRTQVKQFLNANVQKRRDYLKQNANARGQFCMLVARNVLLPVYSVLLSVYNVLLSVYNVLLPMYSVLLPVYSVLLSVC